MAPQPPLRASSSSDATPSAGESPVPMQRRKQTVAVIGAGAAGLVAARELRLEGHHVTVFERGGEVGGTWVYDGGAGPPSPAPFRIHSSLYDGLRVNLPREIMGYSDFPFVWRDGDAHDDGGKDALHEKGREEDEEDLGDARRYCSHAEVLRYLKAFAKRFDLEGLVERDTCVTRAIPEDNGGKASAPSWNLTLLTRGAGGDEEQANRRFDALVVCNGHFETPRVPSPDTIPGLSTIPPENQMHSAHYRTPQPMAGMRVLVVGTGPSGDDIHREIAEGGAKAVYWSGRKFDRLATQACGACGASGAGAGEEGEGGVDARANRGGASPKRCAARRHRLGRPWGGWRRARALLPRGRGEGREGG